MELTFEMHRESFVGVTCGLEGTADFAYFHVLVLFLLGVVDDSFELCLLLLELVNFCHDSLSLLDFTFFTELLCILVVKVNLSFELVYFEISSVLLSRVHLWLVHGLVILLSSLRTVFSSSKTSLDLLVDLGHHLGQLHYELVLVFFLVALLVAIFDEL